MRFPLDGPKRVAFLAELHDATANDACIAYAALVANGWGKVAAYDAVQSWLTDRHHAVLADLATFACQDAA